MLVMASIGYEESVLCSNSCLGLIESQVVAGPEARRR